MISNKISLIVNSINSNLKLRIIDSNNVLFAQNINVEKNLTENIANIISDFIFKSKITFDKIDKFICCNGFGSFTSVRTGVSFIKGLALDKSAFGFDYDEYLRFAIFNRYKYSKIVILFNIGREMPFVCMFQNQKYYLKPFLLDSYDYFNDFKDFEIFTDCKSFINDKIKITYLDGNIINDESLVSFINYNDFANLKPANAKYVLQSYAQVPKKSKYYVDLNE